MGKKMKIKKTISFDLNKIYPKRSRQYRHGSYEPGVYLLWYNEKVVYVGQTKQDVRKRLLKHENKKWNRYSFVPVINENERLMTELLLIEHFNPMYNKIGITTLN